MQGQGTGEPNAPGLGLFFLISILSAAGVPLKDLRTLWKNFKNY